MASVTPYTNLITSQFAASTKYNAMVGMTCQPLADLIALYGAVPSLYDLDVAIGQQLDVVGQWIGVSRNLAVPLTGVYFSLDTVGVGFDEGVWQGPFDPSTGLVALPDEFYRLVLRAKILNNQWAGDKPSAYILMNVVFAPYGYTFIILDPSDLTMEIALIGPPNPPAILLAMLKGGLLDVKPIGVHINNYFYGTAPVFALDINNATFAGFDVGSWATVL